MVDIRAPLVGQGLDPRDHVVAPVLLGAEQALLAVPGTTVVSRPPQDFEGPAGGSVETCMLVPGIALFARPFQNLKTAVKRGIRANFLVQRDIVCVCPL